MNAHTPFDANQDWSNPNCQNKSNDPLVDALLGNAYHVVRTVYCNLGNLKFLYDFLNQYGMVLVVQSEAELKALTTNAKYVRIYKTTLNGKRTIIDYLYVEDDLTGVIPDDPSATGSWVAVSTSSGDQSTEGSSTYILFSYDAVGGETTVNVPVDTVGVPLITVDGFVQIVGKGFEFNTSTGVITLAQELEAGQEVIAFLTGVPASPDKPTIDNWRVINWLYNYGNAVGGEQVIDLPFEFLDVPAIYVNGLRRYKGLSSKSYTIDPNNRRIFLTEPLETNDVLIVTVGGNIETVYIADRTVQEIARGFNIKDSEVILDTDSTTYLNDKVVIYVTGQQKSYKLPTLPTNVRIGSVTGDQLTYVPGNVVVTLIPITIL